MKEDLLRRLIVVAWGGQADGLLFFQRLIEFAQQIGHLVGVEFVRSLFSNHAPRSGWLVWRIVWHNAPPFPRRLGIYHESDNKNVTGKRKFIVF